VLVVAGRDRGDGGVNILGDRTLQVLRLETFTGPAARGCAVIAKRAAHTMIRTGATKQRIDLLDGGLRTAETKLEHAPHRRRQIFLLELPLDRLAVELLRRAVMVVQPLQQPRDLVDPGDRAAGDLGKFGVDLRCRRLRDPPRGFGKLAINTEPALVDLAAQRPERLFRRRQRRQPLKQLTFDFDILPTIVVEPVQTIIIVKPINAGRTLVSVRPPRLRHLMHQAFASDNLAVG
jgi:hypothetical protein